jgi:hypothetical protein
MKADSAFYLVPLVSYTMGTAGSFPEGKATGA